MAIQGTLTINTRERGAAMGDLFGIFFEDLNHAADGGLYAELIHNRSFEFDPIDHPDYHALYAWDKVERGGGRGEVRIEKELPLHPRNEHYAVIEVMEAGEVGIMNLGFNSGIPLRAGEAYLFSMYARQEGGTGMQVKVTLEGVEGNVYAETTIAVASEQWSKYEARLTVPATDFSGRLAVTTEGGGKLYLDMISLFPSRVFRNRNNGLREDIASLIAELKPKFMRFPGGCLIHDGSLDANARNSMYRWKKTIGGVEAPPASLHNSGRVQAERLNSDSVHFL